MSEEEVKVLFKVLLEDLSTSGIITRVEAGHGGEIPKQCSDPVAFFATYATGFVNSYQGNFRNLDADEQSQALTNFLRRKFSTDRYGQCMGPQNPKRRKKLSWMGFFITDVELPQIVERVMAAYAVQISQ